MSKFLGKIERLVDKIPEGIEHGKATIQGIVNPNHRHDSPEEKEHDLIRKEINAGHRYDSFAGIRENNFVKWHIDGHDYMYAVSEILDSAQQCIFILDWWLTPELYLRRPPAHHPEWRLDRLLLRKAQAGVKVYIIVYKEVTQTMSMSSSHTKHALEDLHENIAVMRHPDHIGTRDDVEFWSHHEKVVVVDNHRACVGGLDLCFGRWDTHTHPLADVHPTDFSLTLFPGQDYNNARLLDFQHVDNYVSNAISILESPRMPWHDVHMTFSGLAVLDVCQHFVERWNEVKKRKYAKDERYDWLALPHDINVAPTEAVARHPHFQHWCDKGRAFRQRFLINPHEFQWNRDEEDEQVYPRNPVGSCRVQVVRSVSDWSHGVLTEHSIQNAYCQLIMEANHYIYIENQFFISNTGPNGPVKNQIAAALVQRILMAARDGQKFKVVIVIPEVPGFAGNIEKDTSLKTILAAQYRTINRGGHSIYEEIKKAGYTPEDYLRVYHLRSYDRINAPYNTYIKQIQDNSGVSFYEAQVALAKQWIVTAPTPSIANHFSTLSLHRTSTTTPQSKPVPIPQTVSIKVAKPSTEGISQSQGSQDVVEVPLPASEREAVEKIESFQEAAKAIRGDESVSDSVAQHMMRDATDLLSEIWLGDEQEEKDAYVSEELYIHSKVMIIDDRRVIMGSANLNDRSQRGDGDSEIALVVEDGDLLESRMDGKPYMAARFAATLRRKLYREHLGLMPPQLVPSPTEPVNDFMHPAPTPNPDETQLAEDAFVSDPLSDELVDHWNKTAKKNREIFTEVFRVVPSDLVHSWSQYKNYVPNVPIGHVAPDVPLDVVKARLNEVRGALVESPLQFLIDEKDLVENSDWMGLNPTLPVYI
ncbi:phospholipase D/nuclease [Sistotremastrum suecicum HHB10207 ss-3]|uniref:Phospholipase n=1 Tax=Sistotremastrum suecicum HHB10207 ss-3 TaxID=1314776 RepID=A0A166FS07_9AGAM|nr:phospholipase D/nuclease [Sistotremastrum suecicum HHB10207 ss-3]